MASATKETIQLFEKISQTVKGLTKNMKLFGKASQGAGKKTKVLPHNIEELNEKLQKLETLKNKSFSIQSIKRYQSKINETKKSLDKLGAAAKKSGGFIESMARVTRLNQMLEVADKVRDALSFTQELSDLKTNLQISTDLDESGLAAAMDKIHGLGMVYQENDEDIRRSANTLSKEMGISFLEALDLIEQGYKKGANLNGDFLDQLKEYPAQMKEAGLSAQEMIALIAQSGKDGIYSDKALDSVKEAGLALREMGKMQVEALKGIGLKPEDLVGKSSFEAIRLISKKMKNATTQAKQLVLADIFKGAGEDAGRQFIEGLAEQNMDLSVMEEFDKTGAGTKAFLARMQTWVHSAMGEVGNSFLSFLQPTGDVGVALLGISPLFDRLKSSAWLATGATKLMAGAQAALNFVMNLNPAVLIAGAVIALGTAMVWAYQKVDWFLGAVKGAWEGLREFGKIIWEGVIGALKKMLSGITGIGGALVSFFKGDWSEAWEQGKAAVADLAEGAANITPIGMAVNVIKNNDKIAGKFKEGYDEGRAEVAEKEQKKKSEAAASAGEGSSSPAPGIVPPEMLQKLQSPAVPPKTTALQPAAPAAGASKGDTQVQMTLNFDIKQYFQEGKTNMQELGQRVAQVLTEAAREVAFE